MKIWNLTPHTVNYDDGTIQRAFPSEGSLRVNQANTPAEPVDGMTAVLTEYGGVEGFPEGIVDGDVLIVSTIAADAMGKRDDWLPGVHVGLIVPDTGPTCKRENGQIKSVCQFIRK